MKKTITFMACGLMALLAGCQESEEIKNESEKFPMSIEATIDGAVGSRVTSDLGKTEFSSGDEIGVFVNEQAVVKWSKDTDGDWGTMPTAYWPDKSNTHNFYAFYPYVASVSKDGVTMPDLTTQTGTMDGLANYDFLVATASQSYSANSGIVFFTDDNAFQHVSSLITITIDGTGDLASSTINGISLEGTSIVAPSTYSFTNAESPVSVAEGDNSGILTVAGLTDAMSSAGKTYYFIINPKTAARSSMKLILDYTTCTDKYKATKNGLGNENAYFESGKQYNYTLKITDGVLTISGNEIDDWGDGGSMDDIVINGEKQ